MHDACKVSWTFPQLSPPPCPPPPLPPCSPTRASAPPRPPPGKIHKGTGGVHVLTGNGLQTVGHCPSGLAALPRVQVFVRKSNGKSTTLYVSMGDTTECVMSAIQHKLGIPSVEQRLILGATQLQLGRIMTDYRVSWGCTIDVALRLQGGELQLRGGEELKASVTTQQLKRQGEGDTGADGQGPSEPVVPGTSRWSNSRLSKYSAMWTESSQPTTEEIQAWLAEDMDMPLQNIRLRTEIGHMCTRVEVFPRLSGGGPKRTRRGKARIPGRRAEANWSDQAPVTTPAAPGEPAPGCTCHVDNHAGQCTRLYTTSRCGRSSGIRGRQSEGGDTGETPDQAHPSLCVHY